MSSLTKDQKRAKRLIKKRANTQRAQKLAIDALIELQKSILVYLVAKDEMSFTVERYSEVMHDLSGEDAPEFTREWGSVLAGQLARMTQLIPIGRDRSRWGFTPRFVAAAKVDLSDGLWPLVQDRLELELEEAQES